LESNQLPSGYEPPALTDELHPHYLKYNIDMAGLQNLWTKQRIKQLTDIRNLVLYVFGIIVLAITWSGVKTVQSNYELQKKISGLRQQNNILRLQNETTFLGNKYLQTDQYLELAARQNFGLAAPGEKVLLVPENVAMKYVDRSLSPDTKTASEATDSRPSYIKNLEDWRDFLLGRKLFGD
jgi:cell division protein FtsB